MLDVGDQLPTVREVVADLAINPNTVAKAYRELERENLVVARQGRGTFVASTLAPASLGHYDELRAELERWLAAADAAGLDEESIEALISATLRETTRPPRGMTTPLAARGWASASAATGRCAIAR